MYLASNLGQDGSAIIEYDSSSAAPSNNTAETIEAVGKLTRAITEPAAAAYVEHVRAEINAERIKAGLPPLVPHSQLPPPPPPPEDNYAIGGIALLIIVYLLLFRS